MKLLWLIIVPLGFLCAFIGIDDYVGAWWSAAGLIVGAIIYLATE